MTMDSPEADHDGEPKVEMVLTPLKCVGKFEEQGIKLAYKARHKDGIDNDSLDETKDIAVGSGLTSEYST